MAVSENWTLATIMSRATQAIGSRGDIALSTASFWANVAQGQVWDAMPHDSQELIAVSSTTSGENKITKPAGFYEMLNLRISSATTATSNTSNDGLRPLNVSQYDALSTYTARPTHYLEYSDWLELWPTPDSAYSLQMRYRGSVPLMTSLTAVPSVATRFRYAVYLKTRELLAEEVNDPEQKILANAEYVRYMSTVPSDRALKQREQHYVGASLPRRYP